MEGQSINDPLVRPSGAIKRFHKIIVCFAMPLLLTACYRSYESKDSCNSILKQLEGAKASWALENHKSGNSVPVDSDLFGEDRYIRRKPICPLGGTYTLGRVDEYARCTV